MNAWLALALGDSPRRMKWPSFTFVVLGSAQMGGVSHSKEPAL